jgi:hypothetical protein
MSAADVHTVAADEAEAGAPHALPSGQTSLTSTRTARALMALIRGYQSARAGRPTGCRYLPTCSEYATEAIDRYGPARGSLLAARRIARCGPWGGHGIDPAPERSAP